jgi:hypothetical protein
MGTVSVVSVSRFIRSAYVFFSEQFYWPILRSGTVLNRRSQIFVSFGFAVGMVFYLWLVNRAAHVLWAFVWYDPTTSRTPLDTVSKLGLILVLVSIGFFTGNLKKSKFQFVYGGAEVFLAAVLLWKSFGKIGPPGIERLGFLMTGMYLIRRGADNMIDGASSAGGKSKAPPALSAYGVPVGLAIRHLKNLARDLRKVLVSEKQNEGNKAHKGKVSGHTKKGH